MLMDIRILIKGATIVGGSGCTAAYNAAVREPGVRITEIEGDLIAGTGGSDG
jgi:glycine/D-amino acid oxidase-like deaminating enzyme